MKKSKIILGMLALTLALVLVAGCGSNQKPAATPPATSQSATGGHEGHEQTMPKGDPMPIMKEMDQQLQDLMKQVKAGQTMDAQKTAGLMTGNVDKVMPHMMDEGLKTKLRQAAADIKDTVNAGKMDPGVMEGKVKAMQEIMKDTTIHLQTMKH